MQRCTQIPCKPKKPESCGCKWWLKHAASRRQSLFSLLWVLGLQPADAGLHLIFPWWLFFGGESITTEHIFSLFPGGDNANGSWFQKKWLASRGCPMCRSFIRALRKSKWQMPRRSYQAASISFRFLAPGSGNHFDMQAPIMRFTHATLEGRVVSAGWQMRLRYPNFRAGSIPVFRSPQRGAGHQRRQCPRQRVFDATRMKRIAGQRVWGYHLERNRRLAVLVVAQSCPA